jgi:hypothetical protein
MRHFLVSVSAAILALGLVLGGANVARALMTDPVPTVDVDCTQFPDNQACKECDPSNLLDCCQLNRKPTGCTVLKRVDTRQLPPTTTTTLPMRRLGYPVLRAY